MPFYGMDNENLIVELYEKVEVIMAYSFDAEKVMNECVEWIRDFFEHNGPDCKAVLGISGGKDSSIAAAL